MKDLKVEDVHVMRDTELGMLRVYVPQEYVRRHRPSIVSGGAGVVFIREDHVLAIAAALKESLRG